GTRATLRTPSGPPDLRLATHGSSTGTQIAMASGWTAIRSRFVFLRSPPSSSYGTGREKRTSILRPRAVSTNGEVGACPAAARASVRVHCQRPLAVTTPISSRPSVALASGKTVTLPITLPTLPASTQLALPANHFAPSILTRVGTRPVAMLLAPDTM